LLGGWAGVLDLFSHFRLQYAAILLVAVGVMAIGKRWKTLAVALAALAVNAVLLAPLWIAPDQPAGDGPTLRVLAYIVLTSNQNRRGLSDWVLGQSADVLVMQEVNAQWAATLDQRLVGYRRLETPTIRENNFGLAVYVRDGLAVAGFSVAADSVGVQRIEAVLRLADGGEVRVIALHTLPPVNARYAELRGKQLAEAGRRAEASAQPVVMLGDFNATRWSAPMRRLRNETAMRDSAEGFGWQGTWPTRLWATGMIPIDQVLVGPELRVEDRHLGPGLGSDHRAVVVDLTLVWVDAVATGP